MTRKIIPGQMELPVPEPGRLPSPEKLYAEAFSEDKLLEQQVLAEGRCTCGKGMVPLQFHTATCARQPLAPRR